MSSGVRKELLDTQTHSGESMRPPRAPLPLMPGMVLLDKYEVERVLGVGGMGVVVSAMHLELGERVAIKAMLAEAAASRDHATRFAREAQAAARIKSEFVARVTDVARLEDGTPFMVMEYLEGETLAAYLDRQGPLPVETAVDTLLEACVALAEAHRLGIVHRDVKPGNLFVAQRPSGGDILKVLDFGISKSDENVTITRTSGAIGTPAYMSPEQLRNAGAVRPTADIWSLGVVLFEMLTGELPYEASSFADICALVLVSPPRTPRSIVPSLPQALEDAILRCLEREQSDRFANIPALAQALAPFASSIGRDLVDQIEMIGATRASLVSIDEVPISGRRTFTSLPRVTPRSLGTRSGVHPTPPPSRATATPTSTSAAEPSGRNHRSWPLVVAAATAGALLVAATWMALRGPTAQVDVPASASAPATETSAVRDGGGPSAADVAPADVAPADVAPADVAPAAPAVSGSSVSPTPTPTSAPHPTAGAPRSASAPPVAPAHGVPAPVATPDATSSPSAPGFEDFGGRK